MGLYDNDLVMFDKVAVTAATPGTIIDILGATIPGMGAGAGDVADITPGEPVIIEVHGQRQRVHRAVGQQRNADHAGGLFG